MDGVKNDLYGYTTARVKCFFQSNSRIDLSINNILGKDGKQRIISPPPNLSLKISKQKPIFEDIENKVCLNIFITTIDVPDSEQRKNLGWLLVKTFFMHVLNEYCIRYQIKESPIIFLYGWLSTAHYEYKDKNGMRGWEKSFPFYLSLAEHILQYTKKYSSVRTVICNKNDSSEIASYNSIIHYDTANKTLMSKYNNMGKSEMFQSLIQQVYKTAKKDEKKHKGYIIIVFYNTKKI